MRVDQGEDVKVERLDTCYMILATQANAYSFMAALTR